VEGKQFEDEAGFDPIAIGLAGEGLDPVVDPFIRMELDTPMYVTRITIVAAVDPVSVAAGRAG